ncbi:MAG: heavy-metal-associated domain-containing protein [Spirochaetes bacterium]|uniref:Heavy-metal-associated domain-containing protein n=1 Tax=Candidatus Aphodenecus pullistercoris TaxID=2840669 RepID=A0A9D9EBT7_9SPIR|nr:heavy-metal-associated domain-containing protein [Candidatus Aphodenecus pullistercoris]
MAKTYMIEVDCAACAAKMENAARKTEGVESCVVNFMTQKMHVDFVPGADEKTVMKQVRKACKRVESDAEVYF